MIIISSGPFGLSLLTFITICKYSNRSIARKIKNNYVTNRENHKSFPSHLMWWDISCLAFDSAIFESYLYIYFYEFTLIEYFLCKVMHEVFIN